MGEEPKKEKSWGRVFLDQLGSLVAQLIFLGLVMVGSAIATLVFGFEPHSNRAEGLGMAFATLFVVVALVVAALIWTLREEPRGEKVQAP